MQVGFGRKAWLAGALLAPVLMAAAGSSKTFAEGQIRAVLPASVDAVYKVSFTALGDIGQFRFSSNIEGDTYRLTANAKIDTPIFDYRGNMASHGAVAGIGATTVPANYAFDYKQKTLLKKKKNKAINIAFNDGAVRQVTPFDPPSPKAIPVTPAQLRNVLDPLSGVLALSLVEAQRPCAQKLPIYDGKQRFDLVFSPLRRAGKDHVCKVEMKQISGHKPGEGSGSVVNGDIELVMRPVPGANVVIPYSVSVPTIVGTATLTSDKVDITMPNQQRIALRR